MKLWEGILDLLYQYIQLSTTEATKSIVKDLSLFVKPALNLMQGPNQNY